MKTDSRCGLVLLVGFCLSAGPAGSAEPPAPEILPPRNLVPAPQADPRAPRNHVKVYVFEDEGEGEGAELLGSEVALTHNFGIARSAEGAGIRYQVTCEGGVFSQFQEAPGQFELVSSDFFVGFPLEMRWQGGGARVELYHLSSHLGDEFSERTGRERISFSHESLRALSFRDVPAGRVYFGAEYALSITPDLDEETLIAGVECGLGGEWFVATDFRARARNDWEAAKTVQLARYVGKRRFSLGVELFDGPLPVGQFFRVSRSYIGLVANFRY